MNEYGFGYREALADVIETYELEGLDGVLEYISTRPNGYCSPTARRKAREALVTRQRMRDTADALLAGGLFEDETPCNDTVLVMTEPFSTRTVEVPRHLLPATLVDPRSVIQRGER